MRGKKGAGSPRVCSFLSLFSFGDEGDGSFSLLFTFFAYLTSFLCGAVREGEGGALIWARKWLYVKSRRFPMGSEPLPWPFGPYVAVNK